TRTNSNSDGWERDPGSDRISAAVPLLPINKSTSSNEQATLLTLPLQSNISPSNETNLSTQNSLSSIWIRRRVSNISLSSSKNGRIEKPSIHTQNKSRQSQSTKSVSQTATKNPESLYAMHIINRFVFLIFLLTVIIINIYTWFFYARTVPTKLLDKNTSWYCYDESRLEIVNCINVAGVAIRGGRSATYTCTTDAASLQIQSARLREKRDLVFLNDKFAQYVEKVRYLEAHNRKLAMELNYLQNRSGQGSTHLKVMYETEMQEASKLVEDAKRMAGGVHAKIVEADEELKRQKARFTSVSTSRGTDQKEFHDLLERYIESQGHIALFRRRLADLEDEIRLYKVESQRLTSEISSVQNQIRSELSLRSASDLDRASLSEQFIILKETQEAQLAELRSKLVSVDLDPSKFFRNELAMAIREIRKEYDSLVESQRSELQARYSILINEISVQTQRNETTSALTGEHYREVERMRAELLAAQNQASYFRSKVQQLQNLVSDLQLKIKAFKES
ncbi:unnamed protein product, partial [Rotaria magnacalcarata]